MYSIKKFNFTKNSLENNKEWNSFIKTNSEGHFFFETDYLFYHKERFEDFSLMIYDKKNNLICVLPACFEVVRKSSVGTTAKIIHSHKGLTFGGFIFKDNLSFLEQRQIVFSCLDFLKENDFNSFIIKPLPSYFQFDNQKEESIHRLLNDNLIESKILRVEANSVIRLPKNSIEYQENTYKNYSKRKKRNLKKTYKLNSKLDSELNLKVEKTELSTDFWRIIEDNLKLRHNLSPVHLVDKIQLLKNKFPQNIHFFVVKNNAQIIACCVIFIYQSTIHLQYMAATNEGKQVNALDFLIDEFVKNHSIYFDKINETDKNFTYLSLGVSELRNNKYGNSINEGLFKWKEEFGANTFSHFVYQIDIPS
jgi:hypothetical protein